MPLPTEADYQMAEIDALAQGALMHLRTMHFRGQGKKALATVIRMRAELKEKLTELCSIMMGQAARCEASTMVEPAPPAPPKPRRRKLERIPTRRRRK
jgi:hypothetical protein